MTLRSGLTLNMSAQWQLKGLKPLVLLPVLTEEQPAAPAGAYDTLLKQQHVAGFEGTYSLCGGVNMPKVVKCKASDGHTYKQVPDG